MKKKLLTLILIGFTYVANSQELKYKHSNKVKHFLLIRGIDANYNWENNNANLLIDIGLEKRTISNSIIYGGVGLLLTSVISGIVLNTTGVQNEIKGINWVPVGCAILGSVSIGAGFIIRGSASTSIKSALKYINTRE